MWSTRKLARNCPTSGLTVTRPGPRIRPESLMSDLAIECKLRSRNLAGTSQHRVCHTPDDLSVQHFQALRPGMPVRASAVLRLQYRFGFDDCLWLTCRILFAYADRYLGSSRWGAASQNGSVHVGFNAAHPTRVRRVAALGGRLALSDAPSMEQNGRIRAKWTPSEIK